MTASTGPSPRRRAAGEGRSDPAPVAGAAEMWSAVAAVFVAHFALLIANPFDGLSLLAVEGGLVILVAAVTFLSGDRSTGPVAALCLTWVAAVSGTWALTRLWDLWLATLGITALVVLAVYALHRIELVALGLVEVADEHE
ncbi:hypothetical protein HZS55_05875 [Halosimplex rubrum]|uniref:DUF8163 domain-containing protein n=1 Tax=Halosimplex rubrum TaxID=869889 RepID=A0A7D5P8C4_9EURY|nr:hypothetical protein [Halosimplex rubrum]QLH76860.1 hypothetical protein HZS55_05875 [Halosimplex rubrum]